MTMRSINQTNVGSPLLADALRPTLERTADALADPVERRRTYDGLMQRRDRIEPSINAFE
ncbi:hypothetical protein [uncultured Ruegeria sp.]|uniref:hypothetical protein n=1 Tax=uncultured Ruegeria sp. TaxID=259304 RepID=UPI0026376DA7|nr:hypothetical protein [uncultured Ruegeria sp.]